MTCPACTAPLPLYALDGSMLCGHCQLYVAPAPSNISTTGYSPIDAAPLLATAAQAARPVAAPAKVERTYSSLRRALWVEGGLLIMVALVLTVIEFGAATYFGGPQAVLALAAALLPLPLLIAVGLWLDRFEPEPPWLLVRTFLWGAAVATLAAGIINTIVAGAFGDAASAVVSAPIFEELLKGLAVLWVFRTRREHLHGVTDGIVYALFVGLGFAVVENVLYYGRAIADGGIEALAGIVLLRGVLLPFMHPFFTMFIGIAIGRAARPDGSTRWGRIFLGYLAAVVLHALWNSGIGLVLSPITYIPGFIVAVVLLVRQRSRQRDMVHRWLGPEEQVGLLPPGAVVQLLAPTRLREFFAALRSTSHPLHVRRRVHAVGWTLAAHREAVHQRRTQRQPFVPFDRALDDELRLQLAAVVRVARTPVR